MADLGSTRVFGKLTVMHDAIVKANAEITGNVTAASFAGDGSLITGLDADTLQGESPSAFADALHSHGIGDVTNLQAELDDKRPITESIQTISSNTSAQLYAYYVLTASLTLTLPASPTAGDWVRVSNRSGTKTGVVARNGNNIMGVAEDLVLDVKDAGFTLTYINATQGWVTS